MLPVRAGVGFHLGDKMDCPCGRGCIRGRLKGLDIEDKTPMLDCAACTETHYLKLVMCWDEYEGNYWYEWRLVELPKRVLKP